MSRQSTCRFPSSENEVSTCCDHSDRLLPTKVQLTIAVAGNPNSGKSTIFNALTGLRQHVGNYPGVTVERREGQMSAGGQSLTLVDLPGIYSLSARSPDEIVARDALLGRMAGVPPVDAVLVVLDASNLERNLYLATQIIELGLPVVIACNMMDLVLARGERIDIGALALHLGARVVGTVGIQRAGLDELRGAICSLNGRSGSPAVWQLPKVLD